MSNKPAIRPLGDRVLVQPKEEKEVTRGGIIIPDTAKEKPMEGTVIAVGIKRDKDGKEAFSRSTAAPKSSSTTSSTRSSVPTTSSASSANILRTSLVMARQTRGDCTVGEFEKNHGLPPGTIRNPDGRDTRSDCRIETLRNRGKGKPQK